MDGSNRRVLQQGRMISQPNDITIDYEADHVYWVDARKKEVWRMDLDGGLQLFFKFCL